MTIKEYILPKGRYHAKIINIQPIIPEDKESVIWNSYQWTFEIVKGKHISRKAIGLTPQNYSARGSYKGKDRLVLWLDILRGKPVTNEAIGKYVNPNNPVPLEGLQKKYIDGRIWKIKITHKKHKDTGLVDYRVSSIIEEIK